MNLKGKNITVMGLAKTGIALVQFLNKCGANIFISEVLRKHQLDEKLKQIKNVKYEIEFGAHTEKVYKEKDLIVISPGININLPVIKKAKAGNIPVISEIELAYGVSKLKWIAVTGTNGKSTTSSLIYRILKEKNKNVYLAGNIGNPVVGEFEKLKQNSFLVAEISTFQLEAVNKFRPYIAVLLNITPDHLDRHSNFKEYAELKRKLFSNQRERDFAVLNADDEVILKMSSGIKSRKFYFSTRDEVRAGSYIKNGKLYFKKNGKKEEIFKINHPLLGKLCNIYNFLAAVTVSKILGFSAADIKNGLEKFKPLRHRLDFVKKVKGVTFIDDSKATNPGAVIATLNNLKGSVILIAGGKDKKCGYEGLAGAIAKKVRILILIGKAARKISKEVRKAGFNGENIYMASSLDDAVKFSYKISKCGDVVVLSPACSSFDMFKSAEERGDIFQKLVRDYAKH